MSSSLYAVSEDIHHIRQMRGLAPIKRSDEDVVLERPSQPIWKKPPEKIPLPSNNNNNRATERTSNPFSHRSFDNLHDKRGVSSSSRPSNTSAGRSNPSSKTVVFSRHFDVNGLGLLKDGPKKVDLHNHRPSKKRKTDSGSIVTSNSSSRSVSNHASCWKSEKTHIPLTRSPPAIIDLVNEEEDTGERLSFQAPSATKLGSPLTPTISSDDIGLRSKIRRSSSPSVSQFTDDIPSPISPKRFTKEATNRQNLSRSTGFTPTRKNDSSDAPCTQILMKRHQEDPIDNADDFDNLSLKDDTKPRSPRRKALTRYGKPEIPKDLVKNNVESYEALATDTPALWNLSKAKKSSLIHNMKTKKMGELRRTPVAKPPLKSDNIMSSTDFTKQQHSKEKSVWYPLTEYLLDGRLFKTADGRPYSACFSQEGVSIYRDGKIDSPVVPLISKHVLKRVICPRNAADFISEPIIILWLDGEKAKSSTSDDDTGCLGMKLEPLQPSRKVSGQLRNIWNFTLEYGQVCQQEFVERVTIPNIWAGLLDSKDYQMDESMHNSLTPSSPSTKKAKPRHIYISDAPRPTTRFGSRSGPTMTKTSSNVDHVRRSFSPSSEELILVYPPSGTGALNITYGDLKRLEPGEFLNDTLIEFGLKSWLNDFRIRESQLAEQVHLFSSFFYTQLRQKNLEEGYQSVRKWTSRVDIFKKNYIIVPINEHLHWYLAIICYPGRILQWDAQPLSSHNKPIQSEEHKGARSSTPSSDSNSTVQEEKEVEMQTGASTVNDELMNSVSNPLSPDSLSPHVLSLSLDSGSPGPTRSITRSISPPSPIDIVSDLPDAMDTDGSMMDITAESALSNTPHIFTFDSLGSRHVNVLKTLNSYLRMEAKDKKDLTVSIDAHTGQALVPTQPNSCDCGIYLLHFVEQFMSDPERFIENILNKPQRKSWPAVKLEREQLWNAGEVAGKREALKQKILLLSDEWKQSRKLDDKGKGKEDDTARLPRLSKERDEDSDIEVLEVSAAPSTSRLIRHRAQRLR